jgi:hypothetical protein
LLLASKDIVSMLSFVAIVAFCVLSGISYGILHDLITTRICLEYFTIGHPRIYPSSDPTVLALVWGVVATWWVGLLLGLPLAAACRLGRREKYSVRQLVRPMLKLLRFCAATAVIAGAIGYIAAIQHWIFLTGPMAEAVPQEKHIAFLAALWAHSASYLSGLSGGTFLIGWVWAARPACPSASG